MENFVHPNNMNIQGAILDNIAHQIKDLNNTMKSIVELLAKMNKSLDFMSISNEE